MASSSSFAGQMEKLRPRQGLERSLGSGLRSRPSLHCLLRLHAAMCSFRLQERGVYKFGYILEQQSHKWTRRGRLDVPDL
jgi:hypothetical protein